jgi:hypothetical protein
MSCRISAAPRCDGAGALGGPPKAESGAGSAGRGAAGAALIITKDVIRQRLDRRKGEHPHKPNVALAWLAAAATS